MSVRQADASEIEITSQMVEAGVRAVRVAGLGLLDAEEREVQQVAREVYRAMASCRPSSQPSSLELGTPVA
jgi:hypothetical protein